MVFKRLRGPRDPLKYPILGSIGSEGDGEYREAPYESIIPGVNVPQIGSEHFHVTQSLAKGGILQERKYKENVSQVVFDIVKVAVTPKCHDGAGNPKGAHVVQERTNTRKSVTFGSPLVTASWEIPKIDEADKWQLFYQRDEIQLFRKESRICNNKGSRVFDYDYCDRLVKNLDSLGAEKFAQCEYEEALGAFNHSLKLKTETRMVMDFLATSATVHSIGDVYTRQGKYTSGLQSYLVALKLLGKIGTDTNDETLKWTSVLTSKISAVQRHLDSTRTGAT